MLPCLYFCLYFCLYRFDVEQDGFLKEILTDVILLFVSISEIYGQFKQHISELEPGEDLKWWSLHHGVDMPMAWPAFEVGVFYTVRGVFFVSCLCVSVCFCTRVNSWLAS